jgi:hypothetical protein
LRIPTLILLILGVIFINGCSIASSKTLHLKDVLLIKNSNSEIQEIKIKRLDMNTGNPDIDIIEKQQIDEVWNYLNTINFESINSSNNATYKEHINEYEINIYHSKGNDIIQIKNQGAFLYKDAESYRITNKNLDLSYLDGFLNK